MLVDKVVKNEAMAREEQDEERAPKSRKDLRADQICGQREFIPRHLSLDLKYAGLAERRAGAQRL